MQKGVAEAMRIELPREVEWILNKITEAGFEAYAVGGCIRDTILGRIPEDWDITTSASPMQVKEIFHATIDTGIQHGTVTVMVGKAGFEVTTYRVDGEYEDARHPKAVTFTASLSEDLKRRDFTMNAMAYAHQTGVVDLFGGMEDLKAGIIRCVGEAKERFSEDALRMMRAIRFSAQLGYTIEDKTKEAIGELAKNLQKISAERIQVELTKLVTSDHPETLRVAYETGVLDVILPQLKIAMETEQNHPHHCYSVGEHILHSMQYTAKNKELRLAMMLHDIGKPQCLTIDEDGITHFYGHAEKSAEIAKDILRKLKYDNHTIETVCRLVRYHDYENGITPSPRLVRRSVNRIGEDIFPLLLEIKKADIMAQSEMFKQKKLDNLEEWKRLYEEVVRSRECVSLKTLSVSGKDLIEMGMHPGAKMGETLHELLELVLDHPEYNTREFLMDWVRHNKLI